MSAGRSLSLAVMVVEDDALIAMALQIMLEDEGYVVVGPVSSVQAAMAKVEAQKLDAAILDVNLGREMVFPVADALAAAHIPFVLVTGHSLAMLPAHHRQRPVLNKPFQQRELLDVLRRVIVA